MQIIETLSPQRAVEELRSMGMKINADTMRLGIEQGAYPFGLCIRTNGGAPVYQIYRKLFEQWIEDRATEVDDGGR